jgi:hypothetical protein
MIMSSMATVAPFSPVNFNISPLDYGVRVWLSSYFLTK